MERSRVSYIVTKLFTTSRLFYCLILLVLLSAISMYCQTPGDQTNIEEGPLKRVKRLTPSPGASPQSHSVISSYSETMQDGQPVDIGAIKTSQSSTVVTSNKATIKNVINHRYQENETQTTSTIEIVSDARFGSGPSSFLVLILIHSSIEQIIRRNTIRQTWLSRIMLGNISCAYWFIIGGKLATDDSKNSLQKEQDRYGDLMILWNVRNDYVELTLRSLHSMLHISARYNFSYLLKTDEDVFINTPIILSEILSLYPRQRIYWGRFSCHNPPIEEGRWEERGWHWCDVYHPYAYGGMYILSQDVIQLIIENANSLQHYSCEDVSLGMWLAPYNLHRINDGRIFVQHSARCSRGYIAIHIPHRLSHKLMMKYFDNLKRKGVICSSLSKDDILVWNGLPHSCLKMTKVVV